MQNSCKISEKYLIRYLYKLSWVIRFTVMKIIHVNFLYDIQCVVYHFSFWEWILDNTAIPTIIFWSRATIYLDPELEHCGGLWAGSLQKVDVLRGELTARVALQHNADSLHHFVIQLLLQDSRQVLLDIGTNFLDAVHFEDNLILSFHFVVFADRIGAGLEDGQVVFDLSRVPLHLLGWTYRWGSWECLLVPRHNWGLPAEDIVAVASVDLLTNFDVEDILDVVTVDKHVGPVVHHVVEQHVSDGLACPWRGLEIVGKSI